MFGLSIFNGWNSYTGKDANLDRMTLGPRLKVNEEGNDIVTRLQMKSQPVQLSKLYFLKIKFQTNFEILLM